jgi:hypothetical protein
VPPQPGLGLGGLAPKGLVLLCVPPDPGVEKILVPELGAAAEKGLPEKGEELIVQV